MITDFPERPCHICKSDDWWYREAEWLCGHCHPPSDAEKLKFRVIKGNHKLNIALNRIKKMDSDSEEKSKALGQFYNAIEKLKELNNQLKNADMVDCLYIENGKKMRRCLGDPNFSCMVCPNNYWWEKELMELDRNKNPEVYKD